MAVKNPSPLRYPGGKYKISKLIAMLISKAHSKCTTYVEPFAGGAGVALDLLFSGSVERIVINDSDKAIYSFWRAVLTEGYAFIDMLDKTPVTLAEWERQRQIYLSEKKYSLELGFSAFYLNRTNHSGILSAGPIGGRSQREWKLDVRFDKDKLKKRIADISDHRGQIKIYGKDIFDLVRNILPKYGEDAFIYFDPPYYKRGRVLYQNFFTPAMHQELRDLICEEVNAPWIVSYDDVPEIRKIYRGLPARAFSLNYSLANNGNGHEIMFYSHCLRPTNNEIRNLGMAKQFGI